MAFGLYTHDHNILKITGQCFPLLPNEPKLTLEFMEEGQWKEKETLPVMYPGFGLFILEVENWDNTRDVRYLLD